jgi:2-keto-4-pentenoate hydratase/2-oxohepta-3-ene-1,7-dioic acid hydratase in catechol pathway
MNRSTNVSFVAQPIVRIQHAGAISYAQPIGDGRYALLAGSPTDQLTATGVEVEEHRTTLLPPVTPSKIFGIGVNFPGEEPLARTFPSVFLMPPSAIVASGVPVVLPPFFGSVVAEGELAVVIGRRSRGLSITEAAGVILGYTIANDLSGRDPALNDLPPAVRKGCDGFLPLGPCLLLEQELRDFTIVTCVNDEPKQRGHTRDMLFSIAECIHHISRAITLEPGDVICLGTPPPKPTVRAGDTMSIVIEGIGRLENTVVVQ